MASENTKVLFGLYNDEEDLKSAVKTAGKEHLDIMDVYTPFPVHGLDPAMNLAESRLHFAGFFYGLTGASFGFLAMSWIFTRDWPVIFGGKPFWSVPAYIPITFEMTVLFAAWGMTITFYTICGMFPGVEPKILDNRITDDKFCIAFDTTNAASETLDKLKAFFSKTGASEVHSKVI